MRRKLTRLHPLRCRFERADGGGADGHDAPAFAHRAITTEPSVATLVPCNVVVRSLNTTTTLVEAVDPAAMTCLAGVTDDLQNVVAEVRGQIGLVLDRIAGHTPPTKDR